VTVSQVCTLHTRAPRPFLPSLLTRVPRRCLHVILAAFELLTSIVFEFRIPASVGKKGKLEM